MTMNLKGHSELKHPYKRLVSELNLAQDAVDNLSQVDEMNVQELGNAEEQRKVIHSMSHPVVISSSGKVFCLTRVELNNKTYFLPEPDPIVLNYNIAYEHWRSLRKSDPRHFDNLQQVIRAEDSRNLMYEYFGRAVSFITSLYTAVEATINRSIPKDIIHRKEQPKQTTLQNRQQLMQYATLQEKIKAIEVASGRNIHISHDSIYQRIIRIKSIRDMTIHPKDDDSQLNMYSDLYKELFSLDYSSMLLAVKSFVNFYMESEVIKNCTCGRVDND